LGAQRSDLTTAENAIWTRLLGAVRSWHRWQFAIKAVLIIGGATIGGIGGGIEGDLFNSDGSVRLKGLMVILGTGAAGLGGLLLLVAERDMPKLIGDVRTQLSSLREHLDGREAMIRREKWRIRCAAALEVLLQSVETALLDAKKTTAQRIQATLDVACAPLVLAFGVKDDDWTISVFTREDATEEMVRIAWRWQDQASSARDQRRWKKKQGYTGAAWAQNRAIYEADTSLPEAKARYEVPPEKLIGRDNASGIPADEVRYRSIAALPVRLGSDDEPYGILVVTSDHVGRFDSNPETPGGTNMLTLRQLSAAIALIAAGATKS
jgi:hypothetical protein